MASAIRVLATEMEEMENSFLAIFFEYTNKIAELTQSKLFVVMESSDGLRRIGGHTKLKRAFQSGALSGHQSDVVMDEGGSRSNQYFRGNNRSEGESSKKKSAVESDLSSSDQCSGPGPEAAEGTEVEDLEDRILEEDLPLGALDEAAEDVAAEDEAAEDDAANDQEVGEGRLADSKEKKSKDGGADGILEDSDLSLGAEIKTKPEPETCSSSSLIAHDGDSEDEAAEGQEVGKRHFADSDEKIQSKDERAEIKTKPEP